MAIATNIFERSSTNLKETPENLGPFLASLKTCNCGLHYFRNRYFIWRHGESRANKERIIVSKLENGQTRYGLTRKGILQVKREAKLVRGTIGPDALLFSSPFLRCLESAQIIAEELAVSNIVVIPEIRERDFGKLEKKNKHNYRHVYAADALDSSVGFKNGESVHQVRTRATAIIQELERLYAGRTFILVTHADVGEILQSSCAGLAPHDHRKLPKLKNGECRKLYAL